MLDGPAAKGEAGPAAPTHRDRAITVQHAPSSTVEPSDDTAELAEAGALGDQNITPPATTGHRAGPGLHTNQLAAIELSAAAVKRQLVETDIDIDTGGGGGGGHAADDGRDDDGDGVDGDAGAGDSKRRRVAASASPTMVLSSGDEDAADDGDSGGAQANLDGWANAGSGWANAGAGWSSDSDDGSDVETGA